MLKITEDLRDKIVNFIENGFTAPMNVAMARNFTVINDALRGLPTLEEVAPEETPD